MPNTCEVRTFTQMMVVYSKNH